MLLLGLFIGGPSTAFILSGFNRKLISDRERQGLPKVPPTPPLHGIVERVSWAVGTIVGYAFWGTLLFGPIVLILW